ncbi:MAG: type IV pilus modification protein PilV [Pseudomonadota bacterium]
MNRHIRLIRHQRGVGLIEVLIAVLVLSIGLLGIASLQARTIKNNESSLQRTQAIMLSYFIIDAMRANRDAALKGGYNIGKTCATPSDTGSAAKRDLQAWIGALKTGLGETGGAATSGGNGGNTCGQVQCDNAGNCVITVIWDESRAETGSTAQALATSTRL